MGLVRQIKDTGNNLVGEVEKSRSRGGGQENAKRSSVRWRWVVRMGVAAIERAGQVEEDGICAAN